MMREWRPRVESNHYLKFRKLLFYPLNYGDSRIGRKVSLAGEEFNLSSVDRFLSGQCFLRTKIRKALEQTASNLKPENQIQQIFQEATVIIVVVLRFTFP